MYRRVLATDHREVCRKIDRKVVIDIDIEGERAKDRGGGIGKERQRYTEVCI